MTVVSIQPSHVFSGQTSLTYTDQLTVSKASHDKVSSNLGDL